ncbi:MAG: zinc dependent phospholipase C family protein [Peptostreptococcaceae bacterium]|nr:zinc dependent phospholipase C family protein [Peptostreptococcaceae bacterium]
MLGLHGPDILFFHKVYKATPINKEGSDIHRKAGKDFFNRTIPYVKAYPTPENLSYILGFMCHFMLDTACHPLVNEYMTKENLSHSTVEMEFDSYIIRSLKKDPLLINQIFHIQSNLDLGEIISPFYRTTTPKTVYDSINWMKHILNIMTSSSTSKRNLVGELLKATNKYDTHGGMIVTSVPNPKSLESSQILLDELLSTVDKTNKELDYLLTCISDNKPLSDRTNLNFNGVTVN